MPITSVMDTPVPPVGLVAWCNTCQCYVSDGSAGQRCPTGDPVCYSILVSRRAMSCPLGSCQEKDLVVLATASQSARDVWRIHLMAEHDI